MRQGPKGAVGESRFDGPVGAGSFDLSRGGGFEAEAKVV